MTSKGPKSDYFELSKKHCSVSTNYNLSVVSIEYDLEGVLLMELR